MCAGYGDPGELLGLSLHRPEHRGSTCRRARVRRGSDDDLGRGSWKAATRCFSTGPSGARTRCKTRARGACRRRKWVTSRSGARKASLIRIAGLPARDKIYVHINNTNPVLKDGSPERLLVEAVGAEVGRDGMEFVL